MGALRARPMARPMTPDVIAAFETWREPAYHYAIAIWRASKFKSRAYSRTKAEYAAMQATAIILKSRLSLLIPVRR